MTPNTDLGPNLLRAVQEICIHWRILPSSYILLGRFRKLYDVPTIRGDSADIWEGECGSALVSIKHLRGFTLSGSGERTAVSDKSQMRQAEPFMIYVRHFTAKWCSGNNCR